MSLPAEAWAKAGFDTFFENAAKAAFSKNTHHERI
jgi:hypothetical protein